ncbi:MAG TPA: hypothetical protein VJ417_14710, partial [Candidatus Glassbacteria bacterium]|nr:hypothetical protein [Candidatus Glassbacteria bacterium]
DGLHNLWHDPYSKLFTSTAISTFTNVVITNNSTPGPAQGVTGVFLPDFLGVPGFEIFYGHWANLLIQRQPQFMNAYAFFRFYNFGTAGEWVEVLSKHPRPAILDTRHGKGEVIYYAFAPEFSVALEFDVAGHCPDDTGRYPGGDPAEGMQGTEAPTPTGDWLNLYHTTSASDQVRPLMKATMEYLCGGDCTP